MVVRRRGQKGHRFAESPVLQLALQGWRSRSVAVVLLGAFVLLVARGFYLQVINNDFLQEKGESRYRRDIEVSASRGRIVDRNGELRTTLPLTNRPPHPLGLSVNSAVACFLIAA